MESDTVSFRSFFWLMKYYSIEMKCMRKEKRLYVNASFIAYLEYHNQKLVFDIEQRKHNKLLTHHSFTKQPSE